jgi:hypothetical protein
LNYRIAVSGLLVLLAFAALATLGRDSSSALVGPAAYGDQYVYPHDFVVGTGKRLTLDGQPIAVHVDAQRSPREGATGEFWTSTETANGTLTIRGRVTCLTVVGNRAAARGPVEESTNPQNPVGSQFQIQVTDNGPGSTTPDTEINFFGFSPEDTGCPILPFGEPPITQGNFVVSDA